jgi:hypothetical protein
LKWAAPTDPRERGKGVGLAIASVGLVCLSYRDEIVVSHASQIVGTQRYQGLGSSGCCDELHADRVGTVAFHDGAKVAGPQPVSRDITFGQLALRFANSALTAGTSLTGIFMTVVVVDRYAASSSATASMSDCAS